MMMSSSMQQSLYVQWYRRNILSYNKKYCHYTKQITKTKPSYDKGIEIMLKVDKI